MINLIIDYKSGAQLGGQHVDRFSRQDRLWLGFVAGTNTTQPLDVFALAAGDAVQREDIGMVATGKQPY